MKDLFTSLFDIATQYGDVKSHDNTHLRNTSVHSNGFDFTFKCDCGIMNESYRNGQLVSQKIVSRYDTYKESITFNSESNNYVYICEISDSKIIRNVSVDENNNVKIRYKKVDNRMDTTVIRETFNNIVVFERTVDSFGKVTTYKNPEFFKNAAKSTTVNSCTGIKVG